MPLFSFKIFDLHETQEVNDDGELICTPIDYNWYKFNCVIDTRLIKIISFRQYVLFDNKRDANPTDCLKIFFDDGSYLYSPHTMGEFIKKFNDEYLPLVS